MFPWIGQIPVPLDVGKVKHGFSVVLGKMYQGSNRANDRRLPHLNARTCPQPGGDSKPRSGCPMFRQELHQIMRRGFPAWTTVWSQKEARRSSMLRMVGRSRHCQGWGFQKSLNRVRHLVTTVQSFSRT